MGFGGTFGIIFGFFFFLQFFFVFRMMKRMRRERENHLEMHLPERNSALFTSGTVFVIDPREESLIRGASRVTGQELGNGNVALMMDRLIYLPCSSIMNPSPRSRFQMHADTIRERLELPLSQIGVVHSVGFSSVVVVDRTNSAKGFRFMLGTERDRFIDELRRMNITIESNR